jgi:mevalonate pyrophosphate decarboxylase
VVGYHSEDDGVISITFDTGVDVKVIVSKNPTDALFRFYYLENTGELREFGEVNK